MWSPLSRRRTGHLGAKACNFIQSMVYSYGGESMKIQTIGLVLNPLKPESEALVPEVVAACAEAGVALVAEPSSHLAPHRASSSAEFLQAADALLVLGGDGTILRSLRYMEGRLRPILGVNLGTLGFLAECTPDNLREAVARLARGEYRLEERMLLTARLEGDEEVHTALNEVVITRGSFPRMVQADSYVDGALAVRSDGDGMVVATPTGSTAYSLSTGGPIIAPGLDCLVLSPICPHTLSARPLVVSAQSCLRLEVRPRGEDGGMLFSVDGQQCRFLREASVIHIGCEPQRLPFVRFGEDRFFALLRNKLSKWGGEAPFDA